MKLFIIIILTSGLLLSCGYHTSTDDSKTLSETPVESYSGRDIEVLPTEGDVDGPPFADTCLCDFHEFGTYKISADNYNIYKRGKGWNPKYYSCSWTWGEGIANIGLDDTSIKITKIHLLDLDKFTIPTNSTEFGYDSIKKYVIATFTRDRVGEKCVFDPYNTGKYPKPPQWTEE